MTPFYFSLNRHGAGRDDERDQQNDICAQAAVRNQALSSGGGVRCDGMRGTVLQLGLRNVRVLASLRAIGAALGSAQLCDI